MTNLSAMRKRAEAAHEAVKFIHVYNLWTVGAKKYAALSDALTSLTETTK